MSSGALYGFKFQTFQNALSTTVERLIAAPADGGKRAPAGVVVKNMSDAETVYVGNSADVTSANGFALAPGESVSIPVDDPSKIWAVAGANTPTVCVLY